MFINFCLFILKISIDSTKENKKKIYRIIFFLTFFIFPDICRAFKLRHSKYELLILVYFFFFASFYDVSLIQNSRKSSAVFGLNVFCICFIFIFVTLSLGSNSKPGFNSALQKLRRQ